MRAQRPYAIQNLLALALLLLGQAALANERSLRVTATAYNSVEEQTDESPNIGAWGDVLKPGMKAIAVSPDLVEDYGLKRGTKVSIDGLEGEYTVLDLMPDDWEEKIDIYMGTNVQRALQWGRRQVTIRW